MNIRSFQVGLPALALLLSLDALKVLQLQTGAEVVTPIHLMAPVAFLAVVYAFSGAICTTLPPPWPQGWGTLAMVMSFLLLGIDAVVSVIKQKRTPPSPKA